MGRRTTGKEEFRQRHPYCCYCGGRNKTETVDHVPSTQFFEERKAPYAIWAPACIDCKNTGGGSEQVVSFLARLDPTRKSLKYDLKLMRQFIRSNPRLAQALLPRGPRVKAAITRYGTDSVFDLRDPELHFHVQTVGAKWALALYYVKIGKILPASGGTWVRWWTNADRLDGPILPPEIEAALPREGKVLFQGKMNSTGQFEYETVCLPDPEFAVSFVTCGFAFAMLTVTSPDAGFFSQAEAAGALIHRPGQQIELPRPLSSGPYTVRWTWPLDKVSERSPDEAPA